MRSAGEYSYMYTSGDDKSSPDNQRPEGSVRSTIASFLLRSTEQGYDAPLNVPCQAFLLSVMIT